MFPLKYPVQPSALLRSSQKTLPTMYDLPSEDPEEPGLPDEFHLYQPRLLDATCCPPGRPTEQIFKGVDINLYYDVEHPLWHKRPDWFLVAGVKQLYGGDLRLSYVLWQEDVAPLVVIELLSPGTEAEDLGEQVGQEDWITAIDHEQHNEQEHEHERVDAQIRGDESIDPGQATEAEDEPPDPSTKIKPPGKWQVYERILQVPYYVVFSRYTNRMRAFTLVGDRYQEIALNPAEPKIWIPELDLGLGLWQGKFDRFDRLWLRWYDADNQWIPTDVERECQQREWAEQRAEQAQQRAEQMETLLQQERLEKERLLQRLRQLEAQE